MGRGWFREKEWKEEERREELKQGKEGEDGELDVSRLLAVSAQQFAQDYVCERLPTHQMKRGSFRSLRGSERSCFAFVVVAVRNKGGRPSLRFHDYSTEAEPDNVSSVEKYDKVTWA